MKMIQHPKMMMMIASENVKVTGLSDIIKPTESIDAGDSCTVFPQATPSQRFFRND